MELRTDTHLFGSKHGYEMLACSSGVTDDERVELCAIGFGQTTNERFLCALADEPTAYGRVLASGRFAITRCFRGNPDDVGRATLRLCSIIISANEYEQLVRLGLESVLRDCPSWGSESFSNGERVSISGAPGGSVRSVAASDLVILDAWLTAQRTSGAVSAAAHTAALGSSILRFPEVLTMPDRLRFRWGVQLLSADSPVDVCTLANAATRSGRRTLIAFGANDPPRNSVVSFLAQSVRDGELRSMPPLTTILSAGTTARDQPTTNTSRSVRPTNTRSGRRLAIVLGIGLIVLLGAVVVTGISALTRRPETKAPVNDQIAMEPAIQVPLERPLPSTSGESSSSSYWRARYEQLLGDLSGVESQLQQVDTDVQWPRLIAPGRIDSLAERFGKLKQEAGSTGWRDLPDPEAVEERIASARDVALALVESALRRYVDRLEGRPMGSAGGPAGPASMPSGVRAIVASWSALDANVKSLFGRLLAWESAQEKVGASRSDPKIEDVRQPAPFRSDAPVTIPAGPARVDQQLPPPPSASDTPEDRLERAIDGLNGGLPEAGAVEEKAEVMVAWVGHLEVVRSQLHEVRAEIDKFKTMNPGLTVSPSLRERAAKLESVIAAARHEFSEASDERWNAIEEWCKQVAKKPMGDWDSVDALESRRGRCQLALQALTSYQSALTIFVEFTSPPDDKEHQSAEVRQAECRRLAKDIASTEDVIAKRLARLKEKQP